MPRHGASRLVAVFAVFAEFGPEIVCCECDVWKAEQFGDFGFNFDPFDPTNPA